MMLGLGPATTAAHGTHAKSEQFWHNYWIGNNPGYCQPTGQIGYANLSPHISYSWTWPGGCSYTKAKLTSNLFGTNINTNSSCVLGASIIGAPNAYGNPVQGVHWGNGGSFCSVSSTLIWSPTPWH